MPLRQRKNPDKADLESSCIGSFCTDIVLAIGSVICIRTEFLIYIFYQARGSGLALIMLVTFEALKKKIDKFIIMDQKRKTVIKIYSKLWDNDLYIKGL